jgi:cystathionine beta-lyase
MPYNFDTPIERRGTDSIKWSQFDADVLPMWVADMDFRSPEVVIRALHERAEQGVFGYGSDVPNLRETICERMLARPVARRARNRLPVALSRACIARAVGQPGTACC